MWQTALMNLLLASSPLASVDLKVEPPWSLPDADNRITLELSFVNHDLANVWGYSLFTTARPQTFKVLSRTNRNDVMNDPTMWSVGGKYLEQINDLGYTGVVGVGTSAPDIRLMSLVLEMDPAAPLPQRITFTGIWCDIGFEEEPFETWVDFAPVSVLIPEPAGMVLVLAGVMLRGRRSARAVARG